ncbi:hypothetical protein J2Z69_000351 [Paenibacillus shirakamiensis]|uniref:Helicase XPB/Ssl2 N-terminal domain-containing protein n=1 Tax=Paenibacillus shirakamiensis TaxID=1265935 RepID=A0ABS4JC81_9BACL|nr:helicase-associated domain-containing protein [Paenibacillus shirakamiensis]MBP1999332.1 hypothetical protein [Paenibacillus shirakamiensis]
MTVQDSSCVTAWKQLTPLGHQTFEYIMKSYAGIPFTLDALQAKENVHLSGAELRVGCMTLLGAGLLSSVVKAWGEHLYYVPIPICTELQSILWSEKDVPSYVPQNEIVKEAGGSLVMDIFRTLVFTAKSGIPLTSKGTIHQKVLRKLNALVGFEPEQFARLKLRYPHSDLYTGSIVIVLDMLFALDLIINTGGVWSIQEGQVRRWLNTRSEQLQDQLYTQMVLRYIPPDVWLQQWAIGIVSDSIEQDIWYRVEDVSQLLYLSNRVGLYDERQAEWIEGWLDFLNGTGFMDLILEDSKIIGFRWKLKPDITSAVTSKITSEVTSQVTSKVERVDVASSMPTISSQMLYIQSDFEVLVPPETSLAIRWELEISAENSTYDTMSVYKFSRASIGEALKHGRNSKDILDFLEKYAAGGVPENVESAIKQWGLELGRTQFAEVHMLRCSDDATARTISTYMSNHEAIVLEPIGSKDFIVQLKDIKAMSKILTQMDLSPLDTLDHSIVGFYPEAGLENDWRHRALASSNELKHIDEDVEAEIQGGQRGWIHNGVPIHVYKQSTEIPVAYEELFPGFQEVPAVWWKELRRVHSSTAKSIIEQALIWRTKLRISDKKGEIVDAIPRTIEGENEWKVEITPLDKLTKMWLEEQDIDQIQLLLPTEVTG